MKYNINKDNISRLIFSIKKQLEENKETIKKLIEIDNKYCKMKINLEMLKNILDMLQEQKIDAQKEQKVFITYSGNPCITLNLSILAILTKSTIILDCNQNMIGINKFVVETVNNVLSDFKTDKMVYMENQCSCEVDKIICIDEINRYNSYLKEGKNNVKFYSFNYLDLYSDSDEFEEIEELIYQFAKNNEIPIETYSELAIDEAVAMIANGLGKNIVVLTNDKETKEIFEEKIENKKLYINKNPFETKTSLIEKDIILN